MLPFAPDAVDELPVLFCRRAVGRGRAHGCGVGARGCPLVCGAAGEGGCGCPSLYSGGVIRRPSRGADFGVTRLSARERLPWFDGAAGERPAGGGRLSRDGSWHASQRSVLGRILARDVSFHSGRRVLEPSIITQAILHEHTVKRSVFATIRAETRPFIIITADPAVVLVALPCDSWLEVDDLTVQLQIQHRARVQRHATATLSTRHH